MELENIRKGIKIKVIKNQKWVNHYRVLLTEDQLKYNVYKRSPPIEVERQEKTPDVETGRTAIAKLKNSKTAGPEGNIDKLFKNGTKSYSDY